ncbi:MAG: DUF1592 domain-containing protein [Myxococcota bacterium]
MKLRSLVVVTALCGCTGYIGDQEDPAEDGIRPRPSAPAVCETLPPRIRRLAPEQWDHVLATLTPEGANARTQYLSTLQLASRFGGAAGTLGMTVPHVEQLLGTVEGLSTDIVDRLLADLDCSLEEAGCVDGAMGELLSRAFRREPRTEETERYVSLVDDLTADLGAEDALRAAAEVVLMSPESLYRSEIGEDGVLTPDEIASAISFLVTDGPPDEALRAAARSGQLQDGEVRAEHAERLFEERERASGVLRYFREYLHADSSLTAARSEETFPEFDADVRQAMVEEHRAFVEHVLWEDEGTFRALLTRPYTFANATLAAHYGLPTEGLGDGFARVETPDRMGILNHGSYLVQAGKEEGTSIVFRGVNVIEEFLCQETPAPPPDVDDVLPPRIEGRASTQRQRLEAHRSVGRCATCHDEIDPVGYPFEVFDAVGRPRAEEQGLPIDPSGSIVLDEGRVAVSNVRELATSLSEDPGAHRCFVRHVILFADGVERSNACLGAPEDAPVLDMIRAHIASDDFIAREVP